MFSRAFTNVFIWSGYKPVIRTANSANAGRLTSSEALTGLLDK